MDTSLFVQGMTLAYGIGLVMGTLIFVLFEALDYFDE